MVGIIYWSKKHRRKRGEKVLEEKAVKDIFGKRKTKMGCCCCWLLVG
jgi:hypothetical protein